MQAYEFQDDPILRVFRDTGHRITSQRLAMLDVLRAQDGFLDAETIFQRANERDASLSLATVYRTLALFKEMKLVEGRLVGDDQDREEYRFRSLREYYTLSCKRCGRIVPVEPDIVDAFRQQAAATLGITVLGAHSCFIGYCDDCTAALAAEESEG
jgi:Fe2+ or Zn2+ uptake regulation protein